MKKKNLLLHYEPSAMGEIKQSERGIWGIRATLYKFNEDIDAFAHRRSWWAKMLRKHSLTLYNLTVGRLERKFYATFSPYEVRVMEGNCLLNCGCDIMWDLICGASANHFDNSNATVGVGSDNTAANATQTDLIDGTPTYKGMEATYPTHTSQKATFKSSFGAGDANEAWEEWTIKRTVCLNRKVASLGTKSGGTWTLEVDITLS